MSLLEHPQLMWELSGVFLQVPTAHSPELTRVTRPRCYLRCYLPLHLSLDGATTSTPPYLIRVEDLSEPSTTNWPSLVIFDIVHESRRLTTSWEPS